MKEILGLLYLGIFCSALAYFFAYEAFKRLDGFINYLLLNLIPIVALAIKVIFFDMPLNFIFIIGIIRILGSAISAE
jgi:drug/metabolite transporter (DMT)-like permease